MKFVSPILVALLFGLAAAPAWAWEKAPQPVHDGLTLKQWIAKLKDRDPKVRAAAAGAIALIPINGRGVADTLGAIAPLVRATRDPEEAVRIAAVEALAPFSMHASVDSAVIDAMDDRSGNVRAAAARLGWLWPQQDERIGRILVKLLGQKHEGAAAAAAETLGRLPEIAADSVPALAELVKDADRPAEVRAAAVTALGRLGPATAKDSKEFKELVVLLAELLRGADTKLRDRALRAAGDVGPAAGPALPLITPLLSDADPQLRAAAMWTLGAMGADAAGAVSVIADAARKDPQARVRAIGAASVGRIGAIHPIAVPFLLELLRDKDDEVRAAAAYALRAFPAGSEESVPGLMAALRDPNWDVRAGAAQALAAARAGAEPAVGALIKALRDEHHVVRSSAAQALGAIGPEARPAYAALQEALNDPAGNVRPAAAEAIRKILGK